ncbi:MAG: hypothetical protein IPP42_15380 [Saprospiraceae bacterium]|nr:hypothetical protein [Saprospiraceae bacterium]
MQGADHQKGNEERILTGVGESITSCSAYQIPYSGINDAQTEIVKSYLELQPLRFLSS